MKIVNDGGLKVRPCSRCLKARQAMAGAVSKVTGSKLATHLRVVFAQGLEIQIRLEDNRVVAGSTGTEQLMNRYLHVTVSKKLIDVRSGQVVKGYGDIVEVAKV